MDLQTHTMVVHALAENCTYMLGLVQQAMDLHASVEDVNDLNNMAQSVCERTKVAQNELIQRAVRELGEVGSRGLKY